MVERILQGHAAAHRVADDNGARQLHQAHNLVERPAHIGAAIIAAWNGSGQAEAGQVKADQAKFIAQFVDPWLPSMIRGISPVRQNQGWGPAIAFIANMHGGPAFDAEEKRFIIAIFVFKIAAYQVGRDKKALAQQKYYEHRHKQAEK